MKSEVSSKRGISKIQSAARLGLCAAIAGALTLPLLAAGPGAAGPNPASPPQGGAEQPQKYVEVGAGGASLYNLPDPKGHEVLRVEAGTVLAVYGAPAGGRYLKVAAPGGLKVWIFGKYLRESQRLGWIEVTGSYVNMRPLPRSQDSYPLGQLDRGDRLLFIQRKDPSRPMVDDWVQAYSPSGTMAYILAAETRALPAGADGKALWTAGVSAAVAAHEKSAGPLPREAAAPSGGNTQAPTTGAAPQGGIYAALAAVDAEADRQLATKNPDFTALLLSYEELLAMGPEGPTRNLINQRIEKIRAQRELAAIRADIAMANAERQQRLAELDKTIAEASRERDPLWGRFQARGWLERKRVDGQKIYLVRWGSEFIAEVECSSGRYNLELFRDFEIGVRGVPVKAAGEERGAYPVIDVDRLEVISARYHGHIGQR